ncbi:hypothetical protein V7075_08730 [Neobacillus drentensis]|uniref:hypothetical protein n=1 Tax=Neobacillus drentensis TaxID=220684 RepID=UPI002FFE338B
MNKNRIPVVVPGPRLIIVTITTIQEPFSINHLITQEPKLAIIGGVITILGDALASIGEVVQLNIDVSADFQSQLGDFKSDKDKEKMQQEIDDLQKKVEKLEKLIRRNQK